MRSFLQGFATVMFGVYAWTVLADVADRSVDGGRFVALAVVLCAAPVLVSWVTARVTHQLSPRRMLDATLGSRFGARVLGILSAMLALVGTAVGLRLLGPTEHDGVILTANAALGTFVVLKIFGRGRQPGRCIRCGYDISASLEFGRCPECGTGLSG